MYLEPNENHMLVAHDDETGDELGELCEEVYVREEKIDLLTNDRTVHMVIWLDGEEVPVSMSKGDLNRGVLRPLLRKGLTLLDDSESIKAVLDYILGSCKAAPKVYEHDRLGFSEVKGKAVYLADGVIGDCNKQSHYTKPKITAPHGTLDSWKAFVEREVVGHLNMELAMAIGASAPVAYLLQKINQFNEVPIWCLIGPSSTGKTCSLMLQTSIYGKPGYDGLIRSFHATETALFAMLEDHGMIHAIDESTGAKIKDFSNFLYSLSMGADKLRCDSTGKPKEQKKFSGSVIISGEQSLLRQSSANLGIYARVVELTRPWTDNADHARRILQGCQTNYGTAIIPYAKELLKFQKHPDILEKGFSKELQRFRDAIGEVTGEQERLLNMYASTSLSARLLNRALGLKLNVSGIRDLLVEDHRKSPKKQDLAQNLYDAVLDEVALHGQYFPKAQKGKNNGSFYIPTTIWGEHTTLESKKVLWIVGSKFREFASKNGFENYTAYLKALSEAGLLRRFSNGYTSKYRLGNNEPRCYCLYT